MRPYRFRFTANKVRHTWIRFGRVMETVLADAKQAAVREYPDAHNFLIESDQGDIKIRKMWGLDQ